MVEKASSLAADSNISLREALLRDSAVTSVFDGEALDALLDPMKYVGEAGSVVDRVVERADSIDADKARREPVLGNPAQ
jgi:adenylosuccinate lyase